jgi:hypothetical protein
MSAARTRLRIAFVMTSDRPSAVDRPGNCELPTGRATGCHSPSGHVEAKTIDSPSGDQIGDDSSDSGEAVQFCGPARV